jgi:hypothetical protein
MPGKPTPTFRSGRAIVGIACCVLFSALSLAAQNRAFKGAITDSMCSGPKVHAAMLTKGETLAECTLACVKMGAKFVLLNQQAKTVYQLDDQNRPKAYAARNVLVVGTLDKTTGTIHVADIVLALPPKVLQAKSIYLDCDDCVRAMGKAKQAALDEFVNWKRFKLVQDPQKADLVILFSPNNYLGDFVTRKGPDTRPVHIDITYMNVIDPRTGQSLWGDSKLAGSFRVPGATRDLIDELRAHIEAEENGQVSKLLLQDTAPVSVAPGGSATGK